ncbi:MAG: hypothetical protein V7752_11850 [Halopseudomonas sp.]
MSVKLTALLYPVIRVLAGAVLTALIGCSSSQTTPSATTQTFELERDCSPLLEQLDQQIRSAGLADPMAYPIPRYPYLRSNRLLASFSDQLDNDLNVEGWYQQLYQLGRNARQLELTNLNPPLSSQQRNRVESCVDYQATIDRKSADFQQRLTDSAQVPDDYSDWQQLLGLYPLTRKIVLHQIAKQQQQWRQDFNTPTVLQGESHHYHPLQNRPVQGEPINQAQIARWLSQARTNNPLAIPQLDQDKQMALFQHFAPSWQIFTASPADKIGRPYWHDNRPAVNTDDPIAYWLPSYTRFNGQTLLQLNYLIWFPERPSQHPLDLYSGLLDGLLWRVTLGFDGKVLLYDSIHPCGCYHQIFPVSPRLSIKPLPDNIEQPLILPQVAPDPPRGRLRLQLTPGDHYLQGITLDTSQSAEQQPHSKPYRFEDYQQLRSLVTATGRKGLFDADGLVGHSRRLERFILWPMGVASPGAMRIWGRHAIGFANRRHFDDPYLFEQFFEWNSE